MLQKELGYIKLSLVIFQFLLILLYAPLTGEFLIQLFQGVIIDSFTLGILFALNAYGYYKCMQNRFSKVGHTTSFIALSFQISLPLYIMATLMLALECYLLLTNQAPFQLKRWIYLSKNRKRYSHE